MKQIRACILLLVFYLMLSGQLLATQAIESVANDEPVALQTIPSLHVSQADWAFAGIVTNESGERYIYFFEIQRNYDRFHGLATVIDAQSKTVLVYEESNTLIKNPELTHWQVGNLFLRFNPINSSWVLVLRIKRKKVLTLK